MMKIFTLLLAAVIVLLSAAQPTFAQSPGIIVRPQGGNGITALNPNGDGYSSATTAGFTTDDITQSEIPFKIVPAAITEPTGDLLTGPSAGYSDIVTRVDGSGFYMYKTALNIFFRLRIGSIVSGSKGYSVLIDTDGKMGGSGPNADPNYVAPSGSSPGNPGFEYEVVFQTNFQVAVYSIDGTATPGAPVTYPLNTNSQISVALSTDANNPDYFYDWFVPLTAIGSPTAIRTVVTTVTSPNSALQGTRSDIYGINDATVANTSAAWQTVVDAQPSIDLVTFTGIGATCTSAPVLNTPVATGSSIAVTGTWTRLDVTKPSSATITLYKNGISAGTTTVSTGGTWSITVGTIANGDIFYAKAQAAGESQCLQSNTVIASGCITAPGTPVLTCASLKGISGTMPSTAAGNTVLVYLVPITTASPLSGLLSNITNLTYPTTTSFAFFTNGCSGGTNNVASGMYMIVTQNGSCSSAPAFVCVSSGSSGAPPPLSSNALALTQPIYATNTSINGSGATTGDILRLYINGQYQSSIAATGSSFSFSGLTLNTGDQLQVYSQTGTSCMTQSAVFTVSCFSQPPTITVNATGNLLSGATAISGTSAYPGASVQLYKGTAPSGVATGSPVTVNSSGVWTVSTAALVSGDSYYAIQTVSGCASAASSGVTVLTPAACPAITGSYTDANTTVSGTMPSSFTGTIRLYQDGALIGSQSITAATSWSITVPANTLYYNGALSATAQLSGGAESSGCSSTTVGCTSPSTPSITPTSATIYAGNTVTLSVSNVSTGNWYALLDNSGVSYATTSYRSSSSNFNITTNTFSTTGTYNLKLSADALSGCPASFAAATITVNASLPLVLLNFTGNYTPGQLSFNWSTTDEKNVEHFELEESTNGIQFSSVAAVPVQNNLATVHYYHQLLQRELIKATYYRLRIIDYDGKVQFSKVIILRPGQSQQAVVRIQPNPFREAVTVVYTTPRAGKIVIALTDALGNTLQQSHQAAQAGDNSFTMTTASTLLPGVYFLTVYNEDNKERQFFKVQKIQ